MCMPARATVTLLQDKPPCALARGGGHTERSARRTSGTRAGRDGAVVSTAVVAPPPVSGGVGWGVHFPLGARAHGPPGPLGPLPSGRPRGPAPPGRPLPDGFSTRPFGPPGSFYLHGRDFGDGLLNSCVFVAQERGLLREIHVLHERHAALQSQQPLLEAEEHRAAALYLSLQPRRRDDGMAGRPRPRPAKANPPHGAAPAQRRGASRGRASPTGQAGTRRWS